ncbi:MAG TPA: aldose epimerase family protein [Trebonia sp.]|nr:aldose epimerase family protein [Trebonia sp.]
MAVAALAAGGAATAATQATAAPQGARGAAQLSTALVNATTSAPAGTPSQCARQGSLSICKAYFGSTPEPYTGQQTATYRYTLTNAKGMRVDVLSFGGIIQQVDLPGKHGAATDVTLGFKTLKDYVANDSPPVTANGGPYFGETIGRYGNRIAGGTFTLSQPGVGPVTYTVPVNNGANSLHGGLVGFGNHVWSQVGGLQAGGGQVGLTLQLVSPNGDSSGAAGSPGCPSGCTGYPAQLTVDVTFTLNNSGQLAIHYKARNDSSNLNTVLNLTNHSYFNLAGESSPAGSAYSQLVQINASKYTPTDTTQIPLGYQAPVAGTPFDFRTPQAIGSRIDDVSANFNSPGYNQLLIAQGYDHNWDLNPPSKATQGPGGLNLAAKAWDPGSGRQLAVWTDQPGVQFYSGNFLTGTLTGISGHTYRQGAGYTFETQHLPDSPNEPGFPSTELKAGATTSSTTIFAFSS